MALTLPYLLSHKVNDMICNYAFPKLSLLRLSHAHQERGIEPVVFMVDGDSSTQMLEWVFSANYL